MRPQHRDAVVASLDLASLAQGGPALLRLVIPQDAGKTTSPPAVKRLHLVPLSADAADRGVATAPREVLQGPVDNRAFHLRLFGDDPLHEEIRAEMLVANAGLDLEVAVPLLLLADLGDDLLQLR